MESNILDQSSNTRRHGIKTPSPKRSSSEHHQRQTIFVTCHQQHHASLMRIRMVSAALESVWTRDVLHRAVTSEPIAAADTTRSSLISPPCGTHVLEGPGPWKDRSFYGNPGDKMHKFFDACTHAIDQNAVTAHSWSEWGQLGQTSNLSDCFACVECGWSGSSYTSRGFCCKLWSDLKCRDYRVFIKDHSIDSVLNV